MNILYTVTIINMQFDLFLKELSCLHNGKTTSLLDVSYYSDNHFHQSASVLAIVHCDFMW